MCVGSAANMILSNFVVKKKFKKHKTSLGKVKRG